MNYYRDNIIKLIEGELSSKQKELIQNEISTNTMVNEEYKLQLDIDSYMRAKFLNENAKNETDHIKLEQDVTNLIKEHFEESPDFEILDFLSNSSLDNSNIVKKELKRMDLESMVSGSDQAAEKWVKEYHFEADNNRGNTLDFINDSFDEYKKDSQVIRISKPNYKTRKRRILRYSMISTAASILIFFSVLFFNNTHKSPENLFNDYYESYNYVGVQMRNSELSKSELFDEASVFYTNKQYNKAIPIFKTLIENDQSIVQAYFYLGISQMETNQFEGARENLNQVITLFDEYEIEAKWYLALCYLKTDDVMKSKALLSELQNYEGKYKEDAKDLLKMLD